MISEYLNNIEKSKCPNNCEFKNENLPIIKIPPPKNPKILLISRDPTVAFIPIYEHFQAYEEERRRRMLFTSAIPLSLIVQITKFLRKGNEDTKENKKALFKLYDVSYWTHLHKCPTDLGNNPFIRGGWKKAIICANKWLKEEIATFAKETQLIVCLGRHVEKWVNENKIENIYLPHPSPRNNAVYSRMSENVDEKEIEKNIYRLLKVLKDKLF